MAIRVTTGSCAIAALALACASFPAASQSPARAAETGSGWQVTLESTSQLADASRTIVVSGNWHARCEPQFARMLRGDRDLAIHLTAPAQACDTQRRSPFSVRIDFDALTGEPLPPAPLAVSVYLDGAGSSRLAAFAVVDAARSERAPVPENGFWWAEADEEESWLAGSGVSLELQGDRLAAGLLSFNETGDSAWSFGSGALAGRVAHVPLVQLSRGDSPFHASGNRPVAGPGARLEIALDGPTHAQAWLVRSAGTDAIEVRALELVRSPFRSSPPGSAWAGRWVLVRDGERSAQVLDLRGFSLVDAETFRLVDAASGTALGCRLSAATTTQQADFCTLATDTVDIASFDQVGIDRLSGQGEDGARVQLLRVR